ncbi:hypothetical protein BDW22DRAFT_220161 [Trametopsis cervina]|nr:hypothetical protein BDW22DRAFT_220161 [Trametopsis cervina]
METISEESFDEQSYVDRSVQTSPGLNMQLEGGEQITTDLIPNSEDASLIALAFEELAISEEVSDHVRSDEDAEPEIPSMDTTTRTLKRRYPQQRRPSSATQGAQTSSGRVISLPESVSEYSEKKMIRQIVKMRVASLPDKSGKQSSDTRNPDGSFDSEQSVEHFLPDHEIPSRVRVRSNVTDTPHTPSPLSSPESVIINIGQGSQISEQFLRVRNRAEDSTYSSENSDEDWVTWARSPPRPIPALHGPSSLPYARCPSGAEGTIIETQDNLPRMIWGLEDDDAGNARSGPPQPSPSMPANRPHHQAQVSRKVTPRSVTVPPRFNQVKPHPPREVQRAVHSQPRQPVFSEIRPHLSSPGNDHGMVVVEREHNLPPHGPIDLNLLARPRSALGFSTALLPSDYSYVTGYGHFSDSDSGWHSYPAMDGLRNFVPSSQSLQSLAFSDLGDYAQPSRSSLAVSSGASSHSPHVLDHSSQRMDLSRTMLPQQSPLSSQSTPLHTPITNSAAYRPSALEIAQKYRQQQLVENPYHGILPTPPNSSSPVWSSVFSPYQGALLSPKDLALSLSSSAPVLPVSSVHGNRGIIGSSHVEPRKVSLVGSQDGSLGRVGPRRPANRQQLNSEAPPILINRNGVVPDSAFSSNAIDLSLLKSTLSGTHTSQDRRPTAQPPSVARVEIVQSTPAPLNHSLHFGAAKQYGRQADHIAFRDPTPPVSPETRVRGLSHQQPRSVPLRLIQRRLSTVPEEAARVVLQDKMNPVSPHRSRHNITDGNRDLFKRPVGQRLTHKTSDVLPLKPAEVAVPSVSETFTRPNGFRGAPNKQPTGLGRGRGSHSSRDSEAILHSQENANESARQNTRGRKPNGRRGRSAGGSAQNGPERVDGGLTVHS